MTWVLERIDPPLEMETPKGRGAAHFVIDYGLEHHLVWVCFMEADGACWSVSNPHVRLASNWTAGRPPNEGDSHAIQEARRGAL